MFCPYQGIRVAEIHTSNNFVDERLEGWAWAAGENNPVDYCTKPWTVEDVDENSFWQKGPDFLCSDEISWPIMHDFRTDKLDGERSVKLAVCWHVQRFICICAYGISSNDLSIATAPVEKDVPCNGVAAPIGFAS